MRRLSTLTVILACLLFQVYTRYLPTPYADFTLDDWTLLQRGRDISSYGEAWQSILREPDRPLMAGMLSATFRFIDDRPWGFGLLSVFYYTAFLLLGLAFVLLLTGDRYCALLFGIVFSLIPNLTESFHWPTMIAYGFGLVAYMASAVAWVRYTRSRRRGTLVASVICFALGLGSYEFGIGLPLVYAVLWQDRTRKRLAVALAPFGGVIVFYLLWRSTQAFGMGGGVLFTPRELQLSLWGLAWNTKEILSWWIGENMFRCFREGFNGFAELEKWPRRLAFLANILVVGFAALAVRRVHRASSRAHPAPPPSYSSGRLLTCCLLWVALAHAVSLPAWAPARLNIFPAVGVAFAAALLLRKLPPERWLPWFCGLAFLCLLANQGTARSWEVSGTLHRKLYAYLQRHESEWAGKELVLFDTWKLRQRITPTLFLPPSTSPFIWSRYRNAGLLRGYAPAAMLHLIRSPESAPQGLLDVEHGTRIDGDELIWHERYNPRAAHRTPMQAVYVVDCFDVGVRVAR